MMKQLRCFGDGHVGLEDAPMPVRGAGEVLIRVEASALCGSERRALLQGAPGNTGHEAAGVVVAADVDSPFSVGTRVGASAVHGCGTCHRCIAGTETLCVHGPSTRNGWHAEFIVVPERAVRLVPQEMDPGTAAMLTGDALGVPARALRRAPSPSGGDIIVVGLGPVGLGHVLTRTFTGARVVGLGRSPYRQQLARSLGASEVHDIGQYDAVAPLVIECTGNPEVAQAALGLVADGGVYFQSGECKEPVELSLARLLIHREIELKGSWYYASEDYPLMRELVDDGLPLRDLATHEVNASMAQEAVTDFLAGDTGKVLLRW